MQPADSIDTGDSPADTAPLDQTRVRFVLVEPTHCGNIGAAARAYFGRDPAELTLDEAAALAAMIRAPGAYAPADHPRALLERRNRVLQRLADLGWVSPGRVRRAPEADPGQR